MKHVILIMILVVLGYAAWELRPKNRQLVSFRARRHAIRILIVFIALMLLFVAAVQNPSFQIF